METRRGTPVLVLDAEGEPVTDRNVTDVIGDAFGQGADVVVIPVSRLTPDFFALRTGVAGEILQKFVNYQTRLAILGELPDAGEAFAALVRESNRGRHAWFVADLAELDTRL